MALRVVLWYDNYAADSVPKQLEFLLQQNRIMLAKQTYDATVPGKTATIRFDGVTDDWDAWEMFAAEVRVLEQLAQQGLLTVIFRHVENQTGKGLVDMVTFTRR